jgi:hypothetical protein
MFNGIRPQPTNKWFNSAHLQNKFLICRKTPSNTFGLDKLDFVDHKSPCCFRKKDFLKTKISDRDFPLGTPLPSPPSKKKQVALEKSLILLTCGGPAAATEGV